MRALSHRSLVAAIATLALISAMALPLVLAQEPAKDAKSDVLDTPLAVDTAGFAVTPQTDPVEKKVEAPAPEVDGTPSSNLIAVTTYAFSNSSGNALEDMSSGTSLLLAADTDDASSTIAPIGFDFWFDGVRQTLFTANANGLIRLGVAPVANTGTNSVTDTTVQPSIFPYWDDLWVGNNGKVHYKVVGSAPTRKLVIEWKNEQVPRVGTATSGTATFQLWLYETTGVVEFVYGAIPTATNGYSVGIATTATSFASVTTSTNTVSYATANNTNTLAITSGTKYTFTPNSPAAPTGLNFTAVGLNAMTLNWTDNASNEFGNAIYRSLDGVTYTFVGQTAANATSFAATSLASNTTWFWKVVAVSEGGQSAALTGSQATSVGTLAGTISVGPTGTFTSIGAAVTSINTNGLAGNVILELQSTYVSTVETFPLVVNTLGSPSNTITIRPVSGATNLSITSANATGTLDLSTATNVIIDGRPGGVSTPQLTVADTGTGFAVRFINGASRNTIEFVSIQGISTSTTSGVVLFSTSTGVTGNNNNTIDTCDVKPSVALSFPVNGITSIGTASTTQLNTGNTITNCNVLDFFSATTATRGILVTTNTNVSNWGWAITNNRLFQTATRTYTTGNTHIGIFVNGGNDYNISGNIVGYSASNQTGTYTMTGAVASSLTAIQVQPGVGTNSITNNTISNVSLTSTTGSFAGLSVPIGSASITGNTIGSGTGTGSILVTSTSGGSFITGANVSGTQGGDYIFSNNTIGSLTATGSATLNVNINASQALGGLVTYTNNLIGSTSTANSIQITSTGASATAQQMIGLLSGTTMPITISGNTFANMTNSGTGTAHVVRACQFQSPGISASASGGKPSILSNTIHDITGATASVGVGATSGILVSTGTGGAPFGGLIEQNTVNSIISTNAGTVATAPAGIVLTGSSSLVGVTGGTVSRNKVYDVRNASTMTVATTPPVAVGIAVVTATTFAQVSNNMVSLGDSQATNTEFTGIWNFFSMAATLRSWFNSVQIQGAASAGALPTFGFLRGDGTAASAITTPVSVLNNIFNNVRTGGTGKHYAIGNVNSVPATGWGAGASNNNVLNSPVAGTVGIWGLAADQTFSGWQTASSGDAASLSGVSVPFVSPFVSTGDLHLNFGLTPTPIESRGTASTGVTIDYDNQVRPGPAGSTNGGATAPDIGADEFDGVPGCGSNSDCNDGNPCTDNICSSGTCTFPNNSNSCPSDGNPCTNDVCSGGACYGFNTDPCEDGNACTTGTTCGGGVCGTPNTDPCSDGNPCTIGDACAGGVCVPGPTPPPVQFCNTDGAMSIRDGAAGALPYPSVVTVSGQPTFTCSITARLNNVAHSFPDDIDMLLAGPTATNNLVILSDVGGSSSTIASPVTLTLADSAASLIPDAGPLVNGSFKPTNVVPGTGTEAWGAPAPAPSANTTFAASFNGTNPNGTWKLYVVDDSTGDTGTMSGWCVNVVAICGSDAECDDSNVCTTDSCLNGQCTHTNNSNPCNDSNACTQTDTCSGGTCVGGNPVICNDLDVCTTDTCNPSNGLCVFTPVVCNDNNACTDDACFSAGDEGCRFTNNNSNSCTDSNACTQTDVCLGGTCTGTNPVICNDSNVCTSDSCNPTNGLCIFANNTNPCDDGNVCTSGDVCGPKLTENFDGVTAPAIPAGWTSTVITGAAVDAWKTVTSPNDTAPNAANTIDPAGITDKVLISPTIIVSSATDTVSFRNNFTLESGFDGGVLEISINGGPFRDITDPLSGGSFVTGGYTGTISTGFSSPIAGRSAWTGASTGFPAFITSTATLGPIAAGNPVVLRWRVASDLTVAGTGQNIDSIVYRAGGANSCNPTGFSSTSTACGSSSDTDCDNPDTCDGAGACAPHYEPSGTSCSDGFVCTINDTCNSTGSCANSTPYNCSDGSACTNDTCVEGPFATCSYATSGTCNINGTVRYYRDNVGPVEPSTKGIPSEGVSRNSSIEGVGSTSTDSSGNYTFTNEGGNVTLTPAAVRVMTDEAECHSSITAADATEISKASVGIVILTTNQRIAGDVSNNGAISSFDAALTAQKAVASPCLTYAFPVRTATGSDWAFRPVSRSYTPLTGIAEDYSFLGILYGDVTGNWIAPVLFGQSTDDKPQAPSLETTMAEASMRIPTPVLVPINTMKADGKKAGAVLYVAGSPTHNQDGTWSVMLGMQRADGILGLDMNLHFDTESISVVSVATTGISSAWTVVGHADGGNYQVGLFGVEALQGTGAFLKVTYNMTKSVGGLPFGVAAQANEGQIPISWSGVPRTSDPQIRVDEQ